MIFHKYQLPPLHIALEGCNPLGRDRLALWGTERLQAIR